MSFGWGWRYNLAEVKGQNIFFQVTYNIEKRIWDQINWLIIYSVVIDLFLWLTSFNEHTYRKNLFFTVDIYISLIDLLILLIDEEKFTWKNIYDYKNTKNIIFHSIRKFFEISQINIRWTKYKKNSLDYRNLFKMKYTYNFSFWIFFMLHTFIIE